MPGLLFLFTLSNLGIYFISEEKLTFTWLCSFLAISYLIIGIFRIRLALKYNALNYGWRLTGLAGFVNLDLACYILLVQSHFSLFFAIAMDLIATGLALYRLGLGVR